LPLWYLQTLHKQSVQMHVYITRGVWWTRQSGVASFRSWLDSWEGSCQKCQVTKTLWYQSIPLYL